MGRLTSFNFVTLDGFFKGPNEDTSWHQHGNQEETEYAAEGAGSGSTLVFGRKTYAMMAGFWPTPMAAESMPEVADGMNKSKKIVISNSLKKADWTNTTILRGNVFDQIKELKQTSAYDLTILGSGSIVSQFAAQGLIDIFQIMIDPVVLGEGTGLFNGITQKLNLKLTSTRTFKSGVILLSYEPAKDAVGTHQ